jgi:hypothetical protein
MVYTAERTARNAENDRFNDPGYCQQQCRQWAGIGPKYPDAATAWRNTNDRHPGNRKPPRGSMVFWTGGSRGYGHVAVSLGNGKVRSTDAGGRGRVATVDLAWIERNWRLPYAGWAWDNNEVTIPHPAQKTAATATKTASKPRVHIQNAIENIDKAIKANSKDKAMVEKLKKQRAALVKLAKQK